ncbi:hypothetical protein BT93_B1298 [Corymbia citriodora subsp. variegata]|nr:hypothetical protein BT93_B1298 [Corymbia citriodora subsp. variegata]
MIRVGSQITHRGNRAFTRSGRNFDINFRSAFTDAKYLFPRTQSSHFRAYCDAHRKQIYCTSILPFQHFTHHPRLALDSVAAGWQSLKGE